MIALVVALALAQPKPPTAATSGTAARFISTSSSTSVSAGTANFSCPNNPSVSSPCLSNPNKPLEMGGTHFVSPQDNASDIYMGCMESKDGGYCLQVLNNYGAPGGGAEVMLLGMQWDGDLEVKRDAIFGGDLYIQGATPHIFCNQGTCIIRGGSGGSQISFLLTPDVTQTSGNVLQLYANPAGSPIFTIDFSGALTSASTKTRGSCTLDGASPSKCTATVLASAICGCYATGTTAAAAIAVAANVTSTTLQCTAANGLTNVVNYHCL